MTTTTLIVTWILAVMPALIAIVSFVGVCLKIHKEFKSTKNEVRDMKDIKELKMQMRALLQENHELKHTLNETLTKIDHVRRD